MTNRHLYLVPPPEAGESLPAFTTPEPVVPETIETVANPPTPAAKAGETAIIGFKQNSPEDLGTMTPERRNEIRNNAFKGMSASMGKLSNVIKTVHPSLAYNDQFNRIEYGFDVFERLMDQYSFADHPSDDLHDFEDMEKAPASRSMTPEKAKHVLAADGLAIFENAVVLDGSQSYIEIARRHLVGIDQHKRLISYPSNGEEPTPAEEALASLFENAADFIGTYRSVDGTKVTTIRNIRYIVARQAGYKSPYATDKQYKSGERITKHVIDEARKVILKQQMLATEPEEPNGSPAA